MYTGVYKRHNRSIWYYRHNHPYSIVYKCNHMKGSSRVLAIPDQHYPFHHKDSVDFLQAVYKRHRLKEVVHLGDLLDFHALSQFPTDPDGYSSGTEYDRAITALEHLYRAFPRVKGCYGNHDIRATKKAFNVGLPKAFMLSFNSIIQAPKGWEWRDEWIIDDVLYMHGNGFTGMYATKTMLVSKMQSVVHGHTHGHAGVLHMSISKSRAIMGMNAGCLVDESSYAMAYAKHARVKSSLGCGVVVGGNMHWVPMQLTRAGRWNGEIV